MTEPAADWLVAEASLMLHGPVSRETYQQRMRICIPCPQREVIKNVVGGGYCRKCSCGSMPRANLTVKLHMPAAECPIGNWGPADGEGREHLARIGGVRRQVAGQLRQVGTALLVKLGLKNVDLEPGP